MYALLQRVAINTSMKNITVLYDALKMFIKMWFVVVLLSLRILFKLSVGSGADPGGGCTGSKCTPFKKIVQKN